MKYTELYDEFIKLFPEDKEFFVKKEEETGVEREDGMHNMFGFIVCPFILKISNEDPQKTQRAFDFLEQMELDEDAMVANVAEVSVLEYIMTDENGGMEKFGKYLGKESMSTVLHMSKFFRIDGINEKQNP